MTRTPGGSLARQTLLSLRQYVTAALEAEKAAGEGASTAFYHNNEYTAEGLQECFERNSEGMLKNMAIHGAAGLCAGHWRAPPRLLAS